MLCVIVLFACEVSAGRLLDQVMVFFFCCHKAVSIPGVHEASKAIFTCCPKLFVRKCQ